MAGAARPSTGPYGTVDEAEADQDNQQQQRLQQRMRLFDPASPSSVEASRRRERTGEMDDDDVDDDSRRDKGETPQGDAALATQGHDAAGSDRRESMADID